MSRYARVDDPDGKEFPIGVTHPDDPAAPQGQHLRPNADEDQTVKAENLRGYEDALVELDKNDKNAKEADRKLKPGWYSIDEGKYLGPDRPDV